MPNLLQLNVTANWGSTGKIAEGIGNAAMLRGWESMIAFGRMQNPSTSRLIKVGSQSDVYLHYAKNRLVDGEGRGSAHATKNLLRHIDRFRPDVIHLHNIHDHWMNYPILLRYLKDTGVKVVWTFHDCWAFTGGCPHFVEIGCEQWKTECRKCPAQRSIIGRTHHNFRQKTGLIRELGDNLTIISVSHWLDSLVGNSVLGELNHGVIYNGVDTSTFYPREVEKVNVQYSLQDKKVLLGVSSTWTESKGLSDYYTLRRTLPADYVIVLVGLSKRQASQLPTGIIGIPRTNSVDELAALYSRADAVLCLSKAETFGLTLVEGMACGTPAIGYAATAIKEILSQEVGISVQPGNIDELTAAVLSIGEKRIVFNSETCVLHASTFYGQTQQFSKYIDLYESIY